MRNNQFEIEYNSSFQEDFYEITDYISDRLYNIQATDRLIKKVEQSILKRSYSPLSYEIYRKDKELQYTYYRIYINNFIIFYSVEDNKMIIRRIIYSKRDLRNIVKEECEKYIY